MDVGLNLVMVRPEQMPEIAARAEALGYESVFVPDHVVFPVSVTSAYPYTADGSFPFALDTPLYDPWLVLMQIARATSTIKLGTAVYVLPLRHPFVAARAVTTLDVLSGGRAILGVGAGWLAEEFTAVGLDPRTRFSRTEEAVAGTPQSLDRARAVVPRATLRLRAGVLRAETVELAPPAHHVRWGVRPRVVARGASG